MEKCAKKNEQVKNPFSKRPSNKNAVGVGCRPAEMAPKWQAMMAFYSDI
jgi:hypothetical protein